MVSILAAMGAKTSVDKYGVTVAAAPLNATRVDVADIPDLVPVLAAVMAVAQGESAIVNAGRVRLKESDRLSAVARNLNAIGADITENEDSLIIRGRPTLRGGTATGATTIGLLWHSRRSARRATTT
jgi:3-phosphoshikimate 1-carboxyvinyltransferase